MRFDTDQQAYQSLRDVLAERTCKVIAWVGSGLSAAAGLPTWAGLRAILIASLANKASSLQESDRRKIEGAIETVRKELNPWLAFQILRDHLGTATYRTLIRQALAPADSLTVPEAYTLIWRLRVGGVLNLNIDRLATRALAGASPKITPIEFVGGKAPESAHVLNSPRPFIANLHGIAEDHSTWVFTKGDLDRLLAQDGYQLFLQVCASTSTLLFLGLTPLCQ